LLENVVHGNLLPLSSSPYVLSADGQALFFRHPSALLFHLRSAWTTSNSGFLPPIGVPIVTGTDQGRRKRHFFWKWEGIGSLLILGGLALFAIVNHGVPLNMVFGPWLFTGLLYLVCWWRRPLNGNPTQ
jgi:hypothetical protein